jgi:hypothetical protein
VRNADQTFVGKGLHGLPDRRPADAEAFHQHALGGHFVAGLKLARGDHSLKSIKHFVREFPADDLFEGLGHHISLAQNVFS